MKEPGQMPIIGLIALKLVCCGGLLLAAGAVFLGGILALAGHPLVKTGGVVIVIAAASKIARRNRQKTIAASPNHEPEHVRDAV